MVTAPTPLAAGLLELLTASVKPSPHKSRMAFALSSRPAAIQSRVVAQR